MELECRPIEISQVLINLLNNAFYAVQSSEIKEIQVQTFVNNNVVRIEISDSGSGIPIAIRSKIMEPFFTTKPLGVGTGLGLSISRNMIDSHNGKFYLNEKSLRTMFVVELPLKQ